VARAPELARCRCDRRPGVLLRRQWLEIKQRFHQFLLSIPIALVVMYEAKASQFVREFLSNPAFERLKSPSEVDTNESGPLSVGGREVERSAGAAVH
jgi:hypothetical protein